MKHFFVPIGLLLCSLLNSAAADTFQVSGFTFTQPAKWERVQTASAMRKAQFKVSDAEKKNSAEVVFFHFGPGDGGGVQANVNRWYGQFQGSREQIGAKSEEKTIGKHKVTFVHAEGTYMSGMPGGAITPQPNSALRGAIIEDPQGAVFVKMTGPSALVKASESDFWKMVESALK